MKNIVFIILFLLMVALPFAHSQISTTDVNVHDSSGNTINAVSGAMAVAVPSPVTVTGAVTVSSPISVSASTSTVTGSIASGQTLVIDTKDLSSVLVNFSSVTAGSGQIDFECLIGANWIAAYGINLTTSTYVVTSVDETNVNEQLRFNTTGCTQFRANSDAGATYTATFDLSTASQSMFLDGSIGNIFTRSRLRDGAGNDITSTLYGAAQSLDVNIANPSPIPVSVGSAVVTITGTFPTPYPSPYVNVANFPASYPITVASPVPVTINNTSALPTPRNDRSWTLASGTDSVTVVGAPTPYSSPFVNIANTNALPTPRNDRSWTLASGTDSVTVVGAPTPFGSPSIIVASSNTDISVTPGGTPSKAMLIGGVYSSPAPSPSPGQAMALQVDSAGRLIVNASGATVPISGAPTPFSSPWVNIANTPAVTGSGNFTVVQSTGTNLHAVLDTTSTTECTQATGSNLKVQLAAGAGGVNVGHVTLDAGSQVIGHVINDTGSAVIGHVIADASSAVIGHTITDSGSVSACTLSAETTKVIGTVNQGSGTAAADWSTNVDQIHGSTLQFGQVASTSSIPVTLANEDVQDKFVTGASGEANLGDNICVSTGGSALSVDTLSTVSYRSIYLQIVAGAGISAGQVTIEGSNDNANFNSLVVYNDSLVTGVPINSAITIGAGTTTFLSGKITYRYLRCRISTAFVGGTIQGYTRLSIMDYVPRVFTVAQATAANLNATVTGTVAVTGAPTPFPSPSTNTALINGVAPLMDNGATGSGAQRVTVSNNSLGTFRLWDGTNIATVTASNALKVDGSAVTQPMSMAAAAISGSNPCMNPTATLVGISGATSGTAATQIIAASGSTKIYVCSVTITGVSGTTPTFSLVTGTGSNCASSQVTVLGAWTTAANTVYAFANPVLVSASSSELCYKDGGTSPVQNYNITYVQQ